MKQNVKIILASGSPRRRELLQQVGLEFTVLVTDADESTDITDPAELVEVLSRRKAEAAVAEYLKQAYIPDIQGKEKRKARPSKEGKLGVEGMRGEILLSALKRAGATFADAQKAEFGQKVTKADLYRLGLSGRERSAEKRAELIRELELPKHMSADALLDVINSIMSREEFLNLVDSPAARTQE